MLSELPPEKAIIPPPDGWKEHTLYLVHVSANKHNPVFEAVFHTGFLSREGPLGPDTLRDTDVAIFGGYCLIWRNNISEMRPNDCYYLEAIQEFCSLGDLRDPCPKKTWRM